jgi:N-acetylglucosamine-6-sulfatase
VELSVRSPHTPLEVVPRFQDKHRGETFDLAPSFDEEDVSDKPAWIRQLPRLTDAERQAFQLRREQRLQTLEGANLAMQRALDAFRRVGERQNTYVVFTSDNGFMLGEHRIQTMKSIPYEESIRAPLTISGPGIPHGVVRVELVTNNDLAPTFAAWAHVGAPGVDGRSLIPLLSDNSSTTGEQERWRSALLTENPGQPGKFPGYKAIVTEDNSYVKWSTGERELYDLTSDPYQLENLAGHRPDLEAALVARLDALQDCAGDSCRSAEDP